jgi:pimeloyl-ACP methyl ester carboxylesterase
MRSTNASTAPTHTLERPEGRLVYDDRGEGTLVVCVPGLGDLRTTYRHLVPHLVEAGHRVITLDLRGLGDSDATFADHARTTVGDDVVALLDHLDGGPAHLIGASFGAAAVVWAASHAPERVASVTLVGPFVRDVPIGRAQRLAMRVLFGGPWARRAWLAWYRRLWGATPPPDHDEHLAALRDNLADPGRLDALRAMLRSGSEQIDPQLEAIGAPTLVVMGTADPDFADPAEEARIVAERTGGAVALIDGAGHYPHAERPEDVARAVLDHIATVDRR